MRPFLLAVLLASTAALAEDDCKVEVGPNDVVKQHGDVVIEAGQIAEDVVALEGSVLIKAGAKVKSAVSFGGTVTVERDAVVKTALSMGGSVKVASDAQVGSVVEIGGKGLKVRGNDGKDLDLNLTWDGKSLGQRIADEALAKVKHCKVARAQTK